MMHDELTVFQNLYFAALLKLPSDMPHKQKLDIVEDTMKVALIIFFVSYCMSVLSQ